MKAATPSHKEHALAALEKGLKELDAMAPGLPRGLVTSCLMEAMREVREIQELVRPRRKAKKAGGQ